jgi:hypothetical protein
MYANANLIVVIVLYCVRLRFLSLSSASLGAVIGRAQFPLVILSDKSLGERCSRLSFGAAAAGDWPSRYESIGESGGDWPGQMTRAPLADPLAP